MDTLEDVDRVVVIRDGYAEDVDRVHESVDDAVLALHADDYLSVGSSEGIVAYEFRGGCVVGICGGGGG